MGKRNLLANFIMIACVVVGCLLFAWAYQLGRDNIGIGYLIFLGIFVIAAAPVLAIIATEGTSRDRGDYKGPGGAYGGGPGSDMDMDADYDID